MTTFTRGAGKAGVVAKVEEAALELRAGRVWWAAIVVQERAHLAYATPRAAAIHEPFQGAEVEQVAPARLRPPPA
ncbi:MAG: hypothetical protein ACRDLQ_07700 [Solirubrobacterales bacterium]